MIRVFVTFSELYNMLMVIGEKVAVDGIPKLKKLANNERVNRISNGQNGGGASVERRDYWLVLC